MPNALISVSDKSGVVEFATALHDMGWTLLSTGGTARALREAGLSVRDVGELTKHPEMMDGRVKTLHPAVHAGLLARRDRSDDLAALQEHGYEPIDLVAVNLYPFHEAVASRASIPDAMEKVDIGGPTMLRAAAKNHAHVLVVADPADSGRVVEALRNGAVDDALRRRLAAGVFQHTGRYDNAIAAYFATQAASDTPGIADRGALPGSIELELTRVQSLRYGENPDQQAAFYGEAAAPPGSLPSLRQLHGKELSFNNLLDVEAATTAISAWSDERRDACVIIKHTTPCGIAVADDQASAYERANAADPVSAFGGIVAFNRTVTPATAEKLSGAFLEIIVAPGFDDVALDRLRRKKNLRLIVLPIAPAGDDELDFKRVRGGLLVQQRMAMRFTEAEWRVVTKRQPTASEMRDLRFAWRASAAVKSNAIVLVRDERTIGIGAGQMSRVDSSRIAVMKAGDTGATIRGAALGSDAFFPFRDGVDAAAQAGVRAIVQPGGSVRDDEIITAADEHDMAMLFTGRRVFRH